jgi:hypothetical protein
MPIFHLHVRNISRGNGRSAVAAAAYRAGETLQNEAEERESAFGGRRGVIHTEICLPPGSPAWMLDRAALWNAVEAAERRKDARLAKEIEFALPRELTRQDWIDAARTMAAHYVALGLVVDIAIHDDGTGHNPHVHMMLSTRVAGSDGFGAKVRNADALAFVTEARALWATTANVALAGAGMDLSIDHRSLKKTGHDRKPTTHRGPDPVERAKRRQEATRMTRKKDGKAKAEQQDGFPVPDPEGRPISPAERDRAETALLAELEKTEVDPQTDWWLGKDERPHRPKEESPEPEVWWDRDR